GVWAVRGGLEKAGRRARRQRGDPNLRPEVAAARYGGGRPAQQDADEVLGLLDLPLDVRDGLGGPRDQDLGLSHVDQTCHPAFLAAPYQPERLCPRAERAARDLQLLVQGAQREVGGAEVRDQGGDHQAPAVLGGEELGAGRLGAAAESAPEVELEAEVEAARRREGLAYLERRELA